MIYADTDFFLALLKEEDWLQKSAGRLLEKHRNQIWTSPVTLIELLLLSAEFGLDPERLLVDALEIAELRGGEPNTFLLAAHYLKEKGVLVFDALHAAFCGPGCAILSSDKVFDELGLKRIPLEPSPTTSLGRTQSISRNPFATRLPPATSTSVLPMRCRGQPIPESF